MKKKVFFVSVLILGFLLIQMESSFAQCSMCRAITESNVKSQQNNVGQTLNKGILYLMAVPYLMLGGFVFAFFRKPIIEKIKGLQSSFRIF